MFDCVFFLLAMTLLQKRINQLTAGKKKDVTLLDFIYK
jgi:hypothetical protein